MKTPNRHQAAARTLQIVATSALALTMTFPLSALALGGQTSTPAQVNTGVSSGSQSSSQTGSQSGSMNPGDNSTYATGKPLATQSKEGFWGHMNPFARKKWVKRQLDPVKDRLNELDQLQAKNANDIRALDEKTAAGIHQAQSTADQANQTAIGATTTATQAQQLAQQAAGRTDRLNSTVANLDQYQKVNDTELLFRAGQTALNARAKQALDQIAAQLQGQKGYVLEVEGYSRVRGSAGITSSQHMADAVVRYLVTEHQIPVYRIHQLALGNARLEEGAPASYGNAVRVSVMQNSLAASTPPANTGQSTQ
jgi:outer membrane protein OmpA-like peptidoglycan-associated protein